MLPLAAETFPTTPDELAGAISRGMEMRGATARAVRAKGAALATLDVLSADLTGARFTRDFRFAKSADDSAGGVNVKRLEIAGAPLNFEGTPVGLRVEAEDAELKFAGRPADGALLLKNAASGAVTLAIAHAALESLLHSLAVDEAEKQGVEIKKTKLELTSRGPRALSFRAEVTAKMFVMSADVSLCGNLDVDDRLNARISGLALGGDPMITKLAGTFIRPQLGKLEGRVVPLLAFSIGETILRDVEISTIAGLEIHAKFGRKNP